MAKKVSEREELLWRILVIVVSGIILGVWKVFIYVLFIVNFVIVLFTGKRDKEIASLCEKWNSEVYRFVKYLTFVTNERPFPFTSLKTLSKFER